MNQFSQRIFMLLSMLLLCYGIAHGQYISDRSFENYSSCPNCHNTNNGTGGVGLVGWTSLRGTPDYFNSCYTINGGGTCNNVDVPNNFTGNGVGAQAGEGYIGALGRYISGPNCEYFSRQLNTPLVAGETYKASMYVRKAPDCAYASNYQGMYFSQTLPSGSSVIGSGNAQVLNTTVVTNSNGWTLVEGTFVATGGEQYLTIGIFGGFTSQWVQSCNCQGLMNGAYYLYDNIAVCKDPDVPFDTGFSYDLECKDGTVSINLTGNSQCGNSQYNLYETTSPCTGNACLVNPPLDIESGYDASFDVPYSPGTYYVVKHGMWDDCRSWQETRTLIQLPDYQGSISSPTPICENLDVVVNTTGIDTEPLSSWTLRVEGIVAGSNQVVNPKTYYGCGTVPSSIDLSDPAGDGLFNGPVNCLNFNIPDAVPYNFTCDEFCSYYRITIKYEVCGVEFSAETIVHLICGPETLSDANPGLVCPGDPVTYSAFDPSTGLPNPLVNYNWYNGNGFVNSGANSGPHPYDALDGPYYVESTGSNGCISTSQPLVGISSECESKCNAYFYAISYYSIDGKCYVYFLNGSSPDPGIVSWVWDFGDQTGWNGSNPKPHIYPSLSNYTACLTITTDDGCTDTYCASVGCGKGQKPKAAKRLGVDEGLSFNLYPNPASSSVNLAYDLDLLQSAQLRVIDLTGREIYKQNLQGTEGLHKMNLNEFTNGIYLVQVSKGGGIFYQEKLIVNQ